MKKKRKNLARVQFRKDSPEPGSFPKQKCVNQTVGGWGSRIFTFK